MVKIKQVAEILSQTHTTSRPLLVRTSDHHVCYCKIDDQDGHPVIENELLAAFLLSTWGLSCPESYLLKIDDENVQAELLGKYGRRINKPVAFGSEVIRQSLDANSLFLPRMIRDRKFFQPQFISDLIKIALFDIWVENVDRRQANMNLLLTDAGHYYKLHPIDHVLILFPVIIDPDYSGENDFQFYNEVDHTLLGSEILKAYKRSPGILDEILSPLPDYFHTSVLRCLDEFENFYSFTHGFLNTEYLLRVRTFLFNERRNSLIIKKFNEYLSL